MATTLGTVELDNDMVWADEYAYSTTLGSSYRTIDGKLIMQSLEVVGGRPMTLSGDTDRGWQTRDTIEALAVLAAVPGYEFTTELADGRQFRTTFDHANQPVLEFSQVTPATEPGAEFWYYGSIKLLILS